MPSRNECERVGAVSEQQRDNLPVEVPVDGWVNLRDDQGRVQARLHRGLLLLIIAGKGRKEPHDLRKYLAGESIKPRRAGA